VLDYGAVGDGVTDDTAALQAAVAQIAISGGTLVVDAPVAVSTTLVLKDNVDVRFGPSGKIVWIGSRSGIAVQTDPADVVKSVRWEGLTIDTGASFTGTALAIHSAHNIWADAITLITTGTTSKALTFAADSTGGDSALTKRNITQCWFGAIVQQGTCGTAIEFSGVSSGYDSTPQVVTLNTFASVFVENAYAYGINFKNWTDNNTFSGYTRLSIVGNNSIGVQIGGTSDTTNLGVYSNTFVQLAVDAFGTYTGRQGVVPSRSKLTKIVTLYANPEPEGGVLVPDAYAQSYEVDHQIDSSASVVKYQRGVSHVQGFGFNSSALITLNDDAAASITVSDPSAAGSNICGIVSIATDSANGNGSGWFKVKPSGGAGASTVKHSGDVYFEMTTGALSGTTGTDVRVTVSAHNDGKLYIENRIGSAINARITIFALTQT